VITDRELDAQLAGAAGIHDADLPALPEDFLAALRADAGADLPEFFSDVLRADGEAGSEPASVLAARQLVDDARTGSYRRRRTVVRIGGAVLALAAACVAAVVAPQDRPTDPGHTTSPFGTAPAGGITLVSAEEVMFPLTLDPVPAGLTPTFSRSGGWGPYADQPLVYTADYESPHRGRVLVNLFDQDPRDLADSGYTIEGDAEGTVDLDGRDAEVRRDDGAVSLLWRRADGRWLRVMGEGAYAGTGALVPVAESIVDRPQPIGLQFRLAPAGWSVSGYEESRSLDLANEADPHQLLRLSLLGAGADLTVDTVMEGMTFVGPVQTATIQGQPARMALAAGGENWPDYWYVAGQLPGGRLFILLAPEVLTQEQVVQIADQITFTP
jgi:hypothetical protein